MRVSLIIVEWCAYSRIFTTRKNLENLEVSENFLFTLENQGFSWNFIGEFWEFYFKFFNLNLNFVSF